MRRLFVSLALASACALSFAQPPADTAGYRCGGVGQDEQQRMKAEAPQHDALLTFAVATGAYLADVDVRISDSKGVVVLEGKCDGPLMLVDLPGHGSYRVAATAKGKTQSKTVAIGNKPARAVFVWPAG
jgi:hypothetical protein